jgi:hypothetical protein
MVAVRNLLSTLNSLAQSGLLAGGWLKLAEDGRAPGCIEASALDPWEEEGEYTQGGVEPPLQELLDDPVVRLMMRADRLDPDEVRRVLISRQA